MQKTRKFLSVLLAAVMLISVFTFGASAGVAPIAPDSPASIGLKLEVEHADGTPATNITEGEELTVKIFVTAKKAEDRCCGGMLLVLFNDAVYEVVPDSRVWSSPTNINPSAIFRQDPNTATPVKKTLGNLTAEEKAYQWNAGANIQVANIAGQNHTNSFLFKENAATPFCTFKMNVLPGAKAAIENGTASATLGMTPSACTVGSGRRAGHYTYLKTWTDTSTQQFFNYDAKLYEMDTLVTPSFEAETPAGPVLNRTKTQVKANGADRFLLRTMNSISADDFAALNGDADVIKNIVSAGFVVTTDATWDAKAAETAIASGSTANYKVGKTNYFYKNPAGTYEFGCLLDAPLAQGTNFQYCAFIEYKDAQGATQYLFYKDGAVNLTFEQVDTALKTPMA